MDETSLLVAEKPWMKSKTVNRSPMNGEKLMVATKCWTKSDSCWKEKRSTSSQNWLLNFSTLFSRPRMGPEGAGNSFLTFWEGCQMKDATLLTFSLLISEDFIFPWCSQRLQSFQHLALSLQSTKNCNPEKKPRKCRKSSLISKQRLTVVSFIAKWASVYRSDLGSGPTLTKTQEFVPGAFRPHPGSRK